MQFYILKNANECPTCKKQYVVVDLLHVSIERSSYDDCQEFRCMHCNSLIMLQETYYEEHDALVYALVDPIPLNES